MKKIQYIRPEVRVCELGVQSMMAMSIGDGNASSGSPVEVNDNKFTDIWGNEY